MSADDRMLVNLRLPADEATLEQVKARFGLADDEVDSTFGVIEVDDVEHIYTIRVDAAAASRIDERFGALGDVEGTYSDVRIEPFGPE